MRSAGAIHKDCSRSPSEPWGEVLWMRTCLSSAECDRMHMTGTLQRVIEAGRIAIEAISCEASWCEINSAEDLMVYEERRRPIVTITK